METILTSDLDRSGLSILSKQVESPDIESEDSFTLDSRFRYREEVSQKSELSYLALVSGNQLNLQTFKNLLFNIFTSKS